MQTHGEMPCDSRGRDGGPRGSRPRKAKDRPEARKRRGGLLPRPQRAAALRTPRTQTPGPQSRQTIHPSLLFEAAQLVVLDSGSPGKLVQASGVFTAPDLISPINSKPEASRHLPSGVARATTYPNTRVGLGPLSPSAPTSNQATSSQVTSAQTQAGLQPPLRPLRSPLTWAVSRQPPVSTQRPLSPGGGAQT